MFNNTDASAREKAYNHAEGRSAAWYSCTAYLKAVARYEALRDAYYRKARTGEPVWKSKLYFGTFFIACKGFEARLKSTLQKNLISVKIRNRNKFDPSLIEKESLAQYDLQNDLHISDFRNDLIRMYWFNQTLGTSIARESFTSDIYPSIKKTVQEDRFGNENIVESEIMERKEHTKTDVIHPLNFGHDPNKSEFTHSDWATVRYPMPIRELYRMLTDPLMQKDSSIIRDDITFIIGEIEKSGSSWTPDKGTNYYSDTIDVVGSGSGAFNQNSILVTEYSGDLNYKGNYDDAAGYFGIYVQQYKKWIRIGKSPFRRHPYWKMRVYPDPMSPFGVGACDMQIPLGILKNSVMNQYIDWGNANLKYMYEVYPGSIRGGLSSLIMGMPGGLVESATPEAFRAGAMIRPVTKDKAGVPAISDILNYIERAALEAAPVSNARNKVQGKTDTATGVIEESKKEDDITSSMIDDLDHGLLDGIHQKMCNRVDFVTQPVIGSHSEGSPMMRYFPFELEGEDYVAEVDRNSSSIEANKYVSFLNQVGMAIKMGVPIQPDTMMPLYARIGKALDIPEAEGLFIGQKPEIGAGAMGAVPAEAGAPAPGALPSPPPMAPAPAPATTGAANAMALA